MRRLVVMLATLLVAAGLAAFTSPAHAADRDCGDFGTQRQAQTFFLNHGGPQRDPHRLDADNDGKACESLPCPCGAASSGSGGTSTGGGGGKKQLRQPARVLKVIDGDTIRVRLIGGPRRDVRFIGIDTPEVYGGRECGGPKASRALKRKLKPGNRVRLVSDPTQDYKDRYGRLIRYVIKNGRDINRSQVYGGFSKVYVYNNRPFRRVRSYRTAQANAKASNRNLWRICW